MPSLCVIVCLCYHNMFSLTVQNPSELDCSPSAPLKGIPVVCRGPPTYLATAVCSFIALSSRAGAECSAGGQLNDSSLKDNDSGSVVVVFVVAES